MIPPLLFREQTLLEPHRMELARLVAAAEDGALSFVELRAMTGLTDGNLNRHLHRLEQDGVVETVRDKQPGQYPRTSIRLTAVGRSRLLALGGALREAAAALAASESGVRITTIPRVSGGSDAVVVAPSAKPDAVESDASLVSEAFVGPD